MIVWCQKGHSLYLYTMFYYIHSQGRALYLLLKDLQPHYQIFMGDRKGCLFGVGEFVLSFIGDGFSRWAYTSAHDGKYIFHYNYQLVFIFLWPWFSVNSISSCSWWKSVGFYRSTSALNNSLVFTPRPLPYFFTCSSRCASTESS